MRDGEERLGGKVGKVTGLGRCTVSSSHMPEPLCSGGQSVCKIQNALYLCYSGGGAKAPGCLSLGGLTWTQLCSAFCTLEP